jgi:predicted RecB family nuclease
MTWTSPADIKTVVQKWWDKGELLNTEETVQSLFPRKISLKVPTSSEMSDKFDQVRKWISELRAAPHIRLEMREFKHRILGKNLIPAELWIDSAADALALINKRREALRFSSLLKRTQACEPDLIPWVTNHGLRALELANDWERLLAVVNWMKTHPRPDVYLRQVDLDGIHTKFIEAHRGVLTELFDVVLQPNAVDVSATGISRFARRYGFKDKPQTVRFRMLDAQHALFPSGTNPDLVMDIESFIQLNPKITRVFVTENEVNYLAFPDIPNSMIMFGAGYGFEHLLNVNWLLNHQVFYWGDIDTHGFAILNGLRSYLPLVSSVLMDEETLLRHRSMWVDEVTQSSAESLRFLTDSEALLYEKLKDQYWQPNVRLEQERINWSYVCRQIQKLVKASDDLMQNIEARNRHSVRLNAADIYTYVQPSECDLRVYLKEHDEPEDSPDQFSQIIQRLSHHHKINHLSSLLPQPNYDSGSTIERHQQTLKAIAEKQTIIQAPLLAVQTCLGGIPVELVCEPDVLILSETGYIIRLVKYARNINEQSNPQVSLDLQLSALVFNIATGTNPARLEVFNGAYQIVEIKDDGGALVLRKLSRILGIKLNSVEPYSPIGWSKCTGCLFKQRCWSNAEKARDVALLIGVDQELAKELHREGCKNIDQLLLNYDEGRLSNLQRVIGGRSLRVGKKASGILSAAKSFIENREIVLSIPHIIDCANYVMFDLEGLPPHFEELEKIYLWGMQVFGSNPGTYAPALVGFGAEGDETAWLKFLENSEGVFNQFGDIPFVHWHHYERVKIEQYMERFGDRGGIAMRVLANLVDLLPIVRDSFALPLPSYSLKLIEKHVGYQRSQDEYGGSWAMAMYIQACELKDEEKQREIIDQVLLYNREDLEATWAVLQWLKSYQRTFSQ